MERVANVATDHGKEVWRREIDMEMRRWGRNGEQCLACGEWIGHWGGGGVDRFGEPRPPCRLIPQDVPLQQVRPNCYTVRRHWIGDAIRSHAS